MAGGCTTFVEHPAYVPPPPPLPPPVNMDCRGTGQSTLPAWNDPQTFDTAPDPIAKAAPSYPRLAREAGVQGIVVTRVLVCVNGTVGDVHIVKSIPMLDRAATDAVTQWRFEPGTRGGHAIAMWTDDIPVTFRIH